jgi:hypothetical protein
MAGQEMQIIAGDGVLGAAVALHNLQTRDSFLEGAGDKPLANIVLPKTWTGIWPG